MLKRILIINSDIYAKADIVLDQTGSIQLVGDNNVGKSSLINTLNFLYIVDQRHMKFEADRSLQSSLEHYFPSIQTSFILFEIITNRPSCILVRRSAQNQLEYYNIPHAYEDRWFFIKKGRKSQVTNFLQLTKSLENEHIPLQKLNSVQLYNKIYSQEKNDFPLVHLRSNFSRKGQSLYNPFTKIYKNLIHSSDISATDLTRFLLIAFNKADTTLSIFADISNDSLQKLRTLQEKIKGLEAIKIEFPNLLKAQESYQVHQKKIGQLYYTFLHHYPKVMEKLNDYQKNIKLKINDAQKIEDQLKQEVRKFHEKIGSLKGKQSYYVETKEKVKENLKSLVAYNTPLARTSLQNDIKILEKEKQVFLDIIEKINQVKEPREGINNQVKQLEKKCIAKERQIKSFGQPFIENITEDKNVRNYLSVLLAPDILYSSKDKIKKKITQLTNPMPLFDGLIDISNITPTETLTTLEELQEDLYKLRHQLNAARKVQKETTAFDDLLAKLDAKKKIWDSLQQEKKYLEEEKESAKKIKSLEKEIEQIKEKIAKKEVSQSLHEKNIDNYKKETFDLRSKIEFYQEYRRELDKLGIVPNEELCPEKDLKILYAEIKEHFFAKNKENQVAQSLFEDIRKDLPKSRYEQDRSLFIDKIQQELQALDKLTLSEHELRLAILKNFSQPTYTFLASYRELKKHIKRFSDQLSNHKISGIHKIELHINECTKFVEELEQITQTSSGGTIDFDKELTEKSLEKIEYYIARQEIFHLQDLFRLELRITNQENSRPIRMSMDKQIMSYGTNKVIRLIICLQILQDLVVINPISPIVIYVDEIGTLGAENIEKLLTFCKEVHVLPILAATRYTEGFDKYYPLMPSALNNGKVWVDELHATFSKGL